MIVSVVIPTHNKSDLLALTLAALERQENLADPWEVVVVDDGSTDATQELLAGLMPRWGGRLRAVRLSPNRGRAAARNCGVREASGRWVLFLDDDIVAPPSLLRAHLTVLLAQSGCATIGRVETDPSVVDAPHFHYLDTRGVAKVGEGSVPARYFVTQNAAVAREDLLAVCGFDERFTSYGLEDMEIAFRLEEKRGVRFLALDQPRPRHVHHHTLSQLLAKKRECGRISLPMLALLHPERIAEMRLHWVIDVPDGPPPSATARVLRTLAGSPLVALLEALLRSWPCGQGWRPRLPRAYGLLFDALVLCAYRRGVVAGLRES